MLAALFFYLFAGLLLLASFMVIGTKNPVHAVLFLILAYFNATGLFILLGAEFLAMILLIVYVGAVAVLFLFVVMMLDIDFATLKKGYMKYAPLGALVGFVLLGQLVAVFSAWNYAPKQVGPASLATPIDTSISNTKALGHILYTDYAFVFELTGLLLLVAMIGAIVLTLHHRPDVKRQNIARQVARNPKSSIDMVDIKSGQTG